MSTKKRQNVKRRSLSGLLIISTRIAQRNQLEKEPKNLKAST
jgi:hypothetical protein